MELHTCTAVSDWFCLFWTTVVANKQVSLKQIYSNMISWKMLCSCFSDQHLVLYHFLKNLVFMFCQVSAYDISDDWNSETLCIAAAASLSDHVPGHNPLRGDEAETAAQLYSVLDSVFSAPIIADFLMCPDLLALPECLRWMMVTRRWEQSLPRPSCMLLFVLVWPLR